MLLSSLEICGARPDQRCQHVRACNLQREQGRGLDVQKEDSESRATAVLGSAAPVCPLGFRDPQCLRMTVAQTRKFETAEEQNRFFEQKSINDRSV